LQDIELFDTAVQYYSVANFLYEDIKEWTRESLPIHVAALKKSAKPVLDKAEEGFAYVTKNVQTLSVTVIDKVWHFAKVQFCTL
jgi:hypothetical protein